MIYKVADRNRVVHYNVIGFDCLVLLCEITRCARSVSPASWRRMVDCMACLVRAASLPWCGHEPGQAVRVGPQFDGMVRRQCHRCSDTLYLVYALDVRHLTHGRRLATGRMSDETWCGRISLTAAAATRVADVECVDCLDALIKAGEEATRRKVQLARNSDR